MIKKLQRIESAFDNARKKAWLQFIVRLCGGKTGEDRTALDDAAELARDVRQVVEFLRAKLDA